VYLLIARVLKVGYRRHIAMLLSALLAFMLLGAALFAITQHCPFTTGLYWAITTATTVGYGDVTPKNPSGRFVASAVMLTTIPLVGATFALATGAAASAGIRRVLQMGSHFPNSSYRLIVGMHPSVPAIIDELVKADVAVVLVADVDPVGIREEVHVVRGDPTNPATLRSAKPAGAEHALITADNDGDVLVSAVLLRAQAPKLPISALIRSGTMTEALQALGVQQTVSVDELVAHTLAKSLETPHAGDLLLELLDSERHRLVEVDADDSTIGRQLSAVREDGDGLVLGLVHEGHVSLGIGENPVVERGDHILVAKPSDEDVSE